MRKYLLIASFLLAVGHLVATDWVAEQTYKISLASNPLKSLFVENASLSNNANIVLWTETNVNAQRWILINASDGSFLLKNAYSGKFLTSKGDPDSGVGVCQTGLIKEATAWSLNSVDNSSTNYIKSASGLYLGGDNRQTDGSAIKLVSNQGNAYTWELNPVDAQPNHLTETSRSEMMNGWKNIYYHEAIGRIGDGGFWGDAEMFETILDAYETTGEQQYKTMFDRLHADFLKRQGNNWESNSFNDDIAWIVIASIRAYLMTGTNSYLSVAKSNFDMMYDRAAVLPKGTLIWNADLNARGTNSCINGPAEVAACYLAIATGDESYYEKAKQMYAAQREYLFKPSTGQVYDSFTWIGETPSKYNTWASTYNQGTFLGAAVMLFNHYGDAQYKEDARMIMKYTRERMCNEFGIINTCQGVVDNDGKLVGDLPGFKGILMRYVRRYMVDMNQPELAEWLSANAFQAYNNRNSDGVSCTAWLTKTVENYTTGTPFSNYNKDPFGPSTAVSVAFNTYIGNKTVQKNAFEGVQAENFDYLKGAYTQVYNEVNTPVMLGGDNVANAYMGYCNVNFGSNYAKSIELKVLSQRASSVIEVRLDNPNGELLATVTPTYISGNAEFSVITTELSRTLDGSHRIYLKFTRNTGAAKILIDSFRFLKEGYTSQDITDNGGVITTSVVVTNDTLGIGAVIDNRVTTGLSGTVSGDEWIQYQSPYPVELKGYQLIASEGEQNGNPKSWRLQASDDGTSWIDVDEQKNQLFTAHHQKKEYSVTTSKTYSYFRLFVLERQGDNNNFQLAEWQLHGTTVAKSCITTDGGTLQAQYPDGSNNAIDLRADTYYQAPSSNFWLSYQSEAEYIPLSYSLTTANDEGGDPQSWELYGSNDGMKWALLDMRTEQLFPFRNSTYTYPIPLSSAVDAGCNYFKLHITTNNGATTTQLSEWQVFGRYTPLTFHNDITMSRGSLTTSAYEGGNTEVVQNLTDNDGDTFYTFANTENPWIQYQAPTAVTLKSIALVSADIQSKDPTSILVEYKNEGSTNFSRAYKGAVAFTKRNQRILIPLTRVVTGSTIRVTVTTVADGTMGHGAKLAEIELYGNGIVANDLTVGGNITALHESTIAAETSDKLIDKKESSKFCGDYPLSSWVCCELPNPVKANMYSLTSGNDGPDRDPSVWVMEASNDGYNWTTVDSQKNQSFSERLTTQYYACNTQEETFSFFRLRVTENHGSDKLQLSEWQLHYVQGTDVGIAKPTEITASARLSGNFLYVNTPEEAQIQVYTLSGVLVVAQAVQSGTSTLPVYGISKGVYVARINLPKQTVSLKIIK